MKKIIIAGEASGKIITQFKIYQNESQLTLMNILIQKNIPVASSCNGEGVCKKCIAFLGSDSILTCQVKAAEILSSQDNAVLKFSYL